MSKEQIALLKYISNRFEEQQYEGTWVFPDGKTERWDMGFVCAWFYECLLKELGVDESDLKKEENK